MTNKANWKGGLKAGPGRPKGPATKKPAKPKSPATSRRKPAGANPFGVPMAAPKGNPFGVKQKTAKRPKI